MFNLLVDGLGSARAEELRRRVRAVMNFVCILSILNE